MKAIVIALSSVVLLLGTVPSIAAPNTPVASKDGLTFTVEDLNVYWLRNLGKDGVEDFLMMMVVYQEGLNVGLKPTNEEINQFISDTMSQEIYDQFKQLYSDNAVRRLVEYTIVTGKYENWLREKIRDDQNITVTESEANEYFLSNIDEFHLPAGAYLSIVSVDNKAQADGVLSRLARGDNFNDIAGEVNMDAQMRAERGEIGLYRKGDGLPEPLEEAAFKLQAGQHSEIIKGQNYHILYCHKRYPEVSPSFDEVKEQLMVELREAKVDPYYLDHLDQLMARELARYQIEAELFRPE